MLHPSHRHEEEGKNIVQNKKVQIDDSYNATMVGLIMHKQR
jgi:hypothetical protein